MPERTSAAPTFAMLGCGEAGTAIALDLVAAGASVAAWDPARPAPTGVRQADDAASAVTGADVTLSVNSASVALAVARNARPHLQAGSVFADLNSSSPSLKRQLAAALGGCGARFVDVALMAPVPGRGLATPVLVSGEAAEEFARLLGPLGMPVTVVSDTPGDAAARKLLRSVFMKGMHAAVLEGLAAADRLGWREWYLSEVSDALEGMSGPYLGRILAGSHQHAARRSAEMSAASDLLSELGVKPRVSAAAAAILEELAADG